MSVRCPIHLGPIGKDDGTIATPCGHVFCQECMTDHIKSSIKPNGNIYCPMCKNRFKATKNLTLYLDSDSQSGSPARNQTKMLRDYLPKMAPNASVQEIEIASDHMRSFSEQIAQSNNVEIICFARVIKEAASTFQDVLIPKINKINELEGDNARLKAETAQLAEKIERRDAELNIHVKKKQKLEKDIFNMKMAKKLSDDKLEDCRKELEICRGNCIMERLKSDEKLKEVAETSQSREEELARFKRYAADNKALANKYKQSMRELEQQLHKQIHDKPPLTPLPNHSSDTLMVTDRSLDASENVCLDRRHKRRKVEDERMTYGDVTLDKSCIPFQKKPISSKLPPLSVQRQLMVAGPLAIKNGHLQGAATVGSRRRLGKTG